MATSQTTGLRADVAIVGGGPASLALALSIARQNPDITVRVLERGSKAAHSQQGVLVHPYTQLLIETICGRTVEWTDEIDKFEERTAEAFVNAVPAIYLSTSRHRIYRPSNCSLQSLADTIAATIAAFPNVEIVYDCSVTYLASATDGWLLSVSKDGKEQPLECKLAVLADGRESPLRAKAGIPTVVHDFQGHVTVHAFPTRRASDPAITLVREDRALSTIVDNGMGPNSLVFDMRIHPPMPAIHELKAMKRRVAVGGLAIDDTTQPIFSIDLQSKIVACDHWFSEGILVFGDAAHAMHNLGGQGFNTTAQNAVAFAAPIADFIRSGSDDGIRKFERFRHPYVNYLQDWQTRFCNSVLDPTQNRVEWLSQEGGSLALGQDNLGDFTSVDQGELVLA